MPFDIPFVVEQPNFILLDISEAESTSAGFAAITSEGKPPRLPFSLTNLSLYSHVFSNDERTGLGV